MFKNWNPAYTMEKVLIGLKNEMVANKKLQQPADGDMYWGLIGNWLPFVLMFSSTYLLFSLILINGTHIGHEIVSHKTRKVNQEILNERKSQNKT